MPGLAPACRSYRVALVRTLPQERAHHCPSSAQLISQAAVVTKTAPEDHQTLSSLLHCSVLQAADPRRKALLENGNDDIIISTFSDSLALGSAACMEGNCSTENRV